MLKDEEEAMASLNVILNDGGDVSEIVDTIPRNDVPDVPDLRGNIQNFTNNWYYMAPFSFRTSLNSIAPGQETRANCFRGKSRLVKIIPNG